MKKIFLVFILHSTLCILNSNAQPGEWVWLHGSNFSNGASNYGTLGVPATTNEPPAMYEPCEWRDASGNFWLYGGYYAATYYADLWKYDPVSNMWTWIKGPGTPNYAGNYGALGVSSPLNFPSSRSYGSTTWTDANGNLWLFGGLNASGQSNSDLWKYDITINEWTWISGPNIPAQPGVYGTQGVPDVLNSPGARWECASSWTDNNGDLWLFGGYDGGTYNDLWKYSIATNEWTWMKGSNTSGQPGVWGTQGVEDPANVPSSRSSYTHWKDANGNLWFFGGYDFGSATNYNEMWRYNPLTNNWTWMNGSPAGNASSVYGTQCVADSTNIPGGRYESRAVWTDQLGNFWLLGGRVCCATLDMWNDLWTFCVATNRWTWVSGDNTPNPAGSWGTLGVSSPANKPNARAGAIAWCDNNGHLYLFGGSTFPYPTPYNDLWKFTIDYSCVSCNVQPVAIFTSPNHICPGTCTNFTNLSQNSTSYQWTFAGANPSSSTDVNPQNICYSTPGTYTVSLIATNANGSDTLTLNNFITVYPYPPPQGISQNGDTLFANAGAVSYQWYHSGNSIPGATDYFYVADTSGDFNVVATDANGCEVEAAIFDVVAGIPFAVYGLKFTVYPNPVSEKLEIRNLKLGTADMISIYNAVGEKIYTAIDCGLTTVDCGLLSQGIYWLEIKSDTKIFRSKFVKQ